MLFGQFDHVSVQMTWVIIKQKQSRARLSNVLQEHVFEPNEKQLFCHVAWKS